MSLWGRNVEVGFLYKSGSTKPFGNLSNRMRTLNAKRRKLCSELKWISTSKVCSFWSCTFPAFCSSEQTCALKSTFFILPCNNNFWAIKFFLQRLIFRLMYFTKSLGLLMRWRRMHMTKMNRLYLQVLAVTVTPKVWKFSDTTENESVVKLQK